MAAITWSCKASTAIINILNIHVVASRKRLVEQGENSVSERLDYISSVRTPAKSNERIITNRVDLIDLN